MRLPSIEQGDFVASVLAIAERHDPLKSVRRIDPGPRDPDDRLWLDLVGAGVLEPLHDGDILTTCLVAEALGRCAAPVPYLSRTVAATFLSALGHSDDGDAVTFGFFGADGLFSAPPLHVQGDRIHGVLPFVPDADISRGVVALVAGTETCAVLVPVADTEPTPLVALDGTQPMSRLDVLGGDAPTLGRGDTLDAALNRARNIGTAVHCASLLGAMSWLLDTTVAYTKQRVQFGQPIASRQAVKHSCADMLARVESSRAMVLELADALEDDAVSRRSDVLVSTVKSFVSEAADECASRAFQLHGGIGFTWEHDLHHYFKRCAAGSSLFGRTTHHRAVIAQALRVSSTPLA